MTKAETKTCLSGYEVDLCIKGNKDGHNRSDLQIHNTFEK
jgi:hypothetical protein